MRRAGLAILAAAALLVSAVPAWSGDEGKVAPVASLAVSPQSVAAGEPVALDASGSRDADGSVTSYAWDLDGDGAFERQSGSQATLAHVFETAGTHSVGVRVLDDSGESADAQASVTVAEPQPAAVEPQSAAAEPQPVEPQPQPAAAEPQSAAAAEPRPEPSPAQEEKPQRESAKTSRPRAAKADRIQAAASASVTIRDFAFAPGSVTVSVGDSVTWRNTGDEPHTATARDGSFDTGNLTSGQSGSATFRKAGTFSYFCKPHPFMTATVRVTGGSGGSGGTGSGGGSGSGGSGGTQGVTGQSGSGGSGTGSAADGGSLPSTGLALAPFLVAGLSMLGSGVALRRRCATSRA